MDDIAEFIGGEQDGRTIRVTDPAPDSIKVPRLVGVTPDDLFHNRPTKTQPRVAIDEYKRIGRNDAGHLRYMKSGS